MIKCTLGIELSETCPAVREAEHRADKNCVNRCKLVPAKVGI